MTFFYDLNKKLAAIDAKQTINEGAEPVAERATGDYSAKKAAAGKDIGKPGKMFSKIAKSAGKEYGSKERGEKVAGAVLAKLRAKESVEESDMDESALQAYLGKKKYGETGMKALQKAGRDGASKAKMAAIRAKHDKMDEQMADEGNEFSGELVKARAQGAKSFEVDGKDYPVKEASKPMTPKQKSFAKLAPPADKITFADKIAGAKKEVDEMLGDVAAEAIKKAVKKSEPRSKGTAFDPEVAKGMFAHKDDSSRYDVKDTGYSKRYTRKPEPETEKDDAEVSTEPKKKGRPKGPAKGPERVTAKAWKHKGARKEKTEEDLDTDGVMMNTPSNMSSEDIHDRGEYDREGDMAKDQLHTLVKAAKELNSILNDDENLPEWVQSKITKALDYIKTANDYMDQEKHDTDDAEPVAEKAVSKKQQRFMGMVHAAQKGEKPASKEVAKVAKGMKKKDAEDFAKTKHKGLPEKAKAKKEESVEETADEPKASKSKGGFQFGKGVYESMDKKLSQMLTESMNVSVNMSQDEQGQPSKNITVSADGEDAEALAQLLKMAGMGSAEQACDGCGKSPCGCEELDENSPDWPTNTETQLADPNLRTYSGGLNGPKSTGQTTTPVIASQLRRQVSMEEGVELERNLFKLYQNYKAQ
jgi:hypothetical protein